MKLLAGTILLAALAFQQPLQAQASFGTRLTFRTGLNSQPFAVAFGDINGDGKRDMISTNDSVGGVSIFINATPTGDPTPTFGTRNDVVGGAFPHALAVGDFNGDGKLDVVTGNIYSGNITVYLNSTPTGSSTPSFYQTANFGSIYAPHSASVADFNMDGRLDIALIGDYLELFINTTTINDTVPSFSYQQIFTGSGSEQVAVGDVNGDGKPDAAVTNYGNASKNITIHINNTTAGDASVSFLSPEIVSINGNNPARLPGGIALGDLNMDGKVDMVSTIRRDTILVFFNTTPLGSSTPTFSSYTQFATAHGPYSIKIADVNADGKNDVLTCNDSSSTESIFLNATSPGASTPSFDARTDITFGNHPFISALGDLNGDGLPDLASPSFIITDYISVRFNTTNWAPSIVSFSSPATVGSGGIDATAWGDLNGDGKEDLVTGRIQAGVVARFTIQFNTTPLGGSPVTLSDTTTWFVRSTPEGSVYGTSVVTEDMNGDGKRDIVLTAAFAEDDSVLIYLNTTSLGSSTPSFSPRAEFAAGAYPGGLVTCDLNNDGKNDILVANETSISILMNTTAWGSSTLSFQPFVDVPVGTYPLIATGDVDGDGKKDLAVTNWADGTTSILLNTTTPGSLSPSFAAAYDVSVGSFPAPGFLADLNGDGKLDLVVARGDETNVDVFINQSTLGAASFASPVEASTGEVYPPNAATVADVNGDGKPDLLATVPNNQLLVFVNTSTSSTLMFASSTDLTIGFGSYYVDVRDLNRDGKPDIITDAITGGFAVALNNASFPLPVELATFSAAGTGTSVFLQWSTATETENAGWEVERKTVAGSGFEVRETRNPQPETWNRISFVPGSGTSSSSNSYSYSDQQLSPGRYAYRLKQLNKDGSFEYSSAAEVEVGLAPREFTLNQNYPNPFNPSTTIEFTLPEDGRATLKVYNILGQEVAKLVDGELKAGVFQRATFNADRFATGLYVARLEFGGKALLKKLLLVK